MMIRDQDHFGGHDVDESRAKNRVGCDELIVVPSKATGLHPLFCSIVNQTTVYR